MSEILGIDTDNYAVQSLKSTGGGSATLQSKTASATTEQQVITPDTGYDGLSQVTINALNLQEILNAPVTENGGYQFYPEEGYDGLGAVTIDVNVSGGSIVLPDGISFQNGWETNMNWLAQADTSNITNMWRMFYYNESLTSVPLLDTSNVVEMSGMFNSCKSITSIPAFDTSKVKSFQQMFLNCLLLENVPIFDMSQAGYKSGKNDISSMFASCPLLTNESLNNILASLLTITYSFGSNKKLSHIGLTQAQATTCTTLSNWAALQQAGWTTGY